jgi:hypothetical protein|nr:hypothetical protein [Phenylobacterium sp.]
MSLILEMPATTMQKICGAMTIFVSRTKASPSRFRATPIYGE